MPSLLALGHDSSTSEEEDASPEVRRRRIANDPPREISYDELRQIIMNTRTRQEHLISKVLRDKHHEELRKSYDKLLQRVCVLGSELLAIPRPQSTFSILFPQRKRKFKKLVEKWLALEKSIQECDEALEGVSPIPIKSMEIQGFMHQLRSPGETQLPSIYITSSEAETTMEYSTYERTHEDIRRYVKTGDTEWTQKIENVSNMFDRSSSVENIERYNLTTSNISRGGLRSSTTKATSSRMPEPWLASDRPYKTTTDEEEKGFTAFERSHDGVSKSLESSESLPVDEMEPRHTAHTRSLQDPSSHGLNYLESSNRSNIVDTIMLVDNGLHETSAPEFAKLNGPTKRPLGGCLDAETKISDVAHLNRSRDHSVIEDVIEEALAIILARPVYFCIILVGGILEKLLQWVMWSHEHMERWQGKRCLPKGTVCIRWTCNCGHQSHEYMIEEYENAVSILADQLESSGAVKQVATSSFELGTLHQISQALGNRRQEAKQIFRRLFSHRQPAKGLGTELQTGTSVQMQPLADPLWLLFCINGSDLAILEHVDLRSVCSDNQLFINLRTVYTRLRSKVNWVKRYLTKLGHIHFVQFQLLPKTFVDGFEVNQLPPLTEDSYEYTRVGLKPPVPLKWMLHLYKKPEHGAELKFCYERFPKKKERLEFSSSEEVIGWGIYFIEKLDHAVVLSIMFVLSLGMGLLFGVLWGVLEKDVSAAFAIASFVTSVGALGVASWASWSVLS